VSLDHLRGRHVGLIAKTHVRYSVRGGAGLIFLIISMLSGLIMANVVISPVEQISKMDKEAGGAGDTKKVVDQVVHKVGIPAIKRFTSGDAEQANYLVLEKPALVSAFMVILIFFLPFLVSLGAFNQTAGDIGNRGLRYQLLRTERVNIFVGRFIGTTLFTFIVLAALLMLVLLYLVIKAKFYPAGDVVAWMLRGYLAMVIYALPWIALCAWISTAIDSAFGSMVVAQIIILFWPILTWFASQANHHASFLKYLMPWGYKWWMIHPSMSMFFAGTGVMLGFTALFGFLGLRHFQKRDL